MAPKSKRVDDKKVVSQHISGRNGLGPYTADPKAFPRSVVVKHNEKFVLIRDLYPKSVLHLLLLPRDPIKNRLHPFDYFADATLLAEARTEISSLLPMIESELNRIFGQSSTDRTWSDDLKIGVHANPSMNHVHIHLITPDMTSDCMKHRNHYNSFTTDFFVPLDRFPLEENAPIWNVQVRNSHLKQSLRCWRCKKVVENVPKLKCHLKEELIEWEQGYRT